MPLNQHQALAFMSRHCAFAAAALLVAGCSNLSQGEKAGVAALAVAGTVIAGNTPTTDIEQTYYVGVFDPQDQLPPILYRIRVRGQASALNTTRFASGWVRAELLDSLGSVSFAKDKGIEISKADEKYQTFATGRRLVMFGPEGFREAPAGHRLVIAMGSDPSKFFNAVDEALGVVTAATQGRGSAALDQNLFKDLVDLRAQHDRLSEIRGDAAAAANR